MAWPMSWFELTASLAGSLAWPCVVLVIALVYRREIRGLSRRLSHAKAMGLEASFEAQLTKVEGMFVHLSGQATSPEFDKMATISPKAAIHKRWSDLETAIRVRGAGISARQTHVSTFAIIDDLVARGILDDEDAAAIHVLLRLRSISDHQGANNDQISKNQAERFEQIVSALISKLRPPALLGDLTSPA